MRKTCIKVQGPDSAKYSLKHRYSPYSSANAHAIRDQDTS